MRKKRRVVEGYLDMGRVNVPPLPTNIVFEDRDTFIRYWLTYSGVDLQLSTSIPTSNITIYAGIGGPYLQDGPTTYRLYVASGVLSIEVSADTVNGARVFAMPPIDNTTLEVTAPGGIITATPIDLAA